MKQYGMLIPLNNICSLPINMVAWCWIICLFF